MRPDGALTNSERQRIRRAENEAAREYRSVRVEARLSAPLCGDPPQLDALLENLMGPFHPSNQPESRIDRAYPAPPIGLIPIPVLRRDTSSEVISHWRRVRSLPPSAHVPESAVLLCGHARSFGVHPSDPDLRPAMARYNLFPDDSVFSRESIGWATKLYESGGGWKIGCCSAPILPVADMEGVEHLCKRIEPQLSGLLVRSSLRKIATGNSWTKSYRLPFRIRRISSIVWFAIADRRELLKLLRRVPALGKKRSVGYGHVASWDVQWLNDGDDWSWFAPGPHGPLLMRSLPMGDWLPAGTIGGRRDFGACAPPYWHQDRYCDIVVPC